MRGVPPATRAPIQLESNFDALLARCSAYDLLESAVAVVDAQGMLRYANPAFLAFNHAVRDSVANLSQQATLLACPEIRSWLLASLNTASPDPLRHTFFYAPQIQVELTVCLTCLLTPDGKTAGALLALGEESIAFGNRHLARAQDAYRTLAERIKILDRQKIDTQHLLSVLLKDAPVAMVLFNEKREVVQINQAAASLFEITITDARGKSCEQILPCFRRCGNCPALDSQRNIKNEEIEVAASGSRKLSLLRSVAVLRRQGAETTIVEAFVDVTAKKVAENAKSMFLATMSHELRTPLNAILGFGQLLELSSDPRMPDQQQYIKYILSSGHQLLALVNDLLDLSRIDIGQLELSIRPLRIAELASSCVDQVVVAMANQKNILVKNMITDASLLVQGDSLRLRQVLTNLLSNAVKYNHDHGRVTLSSVSAMEGRLRIEVRDTGNGIASDKLPLLFTPFERIDQKHGTISGVGIGLHIAKQLVEAMHGSIGVESIQGKGSTFWVDLPLANAADKPTIAPGNTSHPVRQADSNSSFVVLYVEDNPVNVYLVKKALQRRTGIELLVAGTAEEGLAIAEKKLPDLILMDIQLPGTDGITATTRLKGSEATKHIPVVALSADAMQEDIDLALSSGCSDYLIKPVELQALYEVIDKVRLAE